jgi:integrase
MQSSTTFCASLSYLTDLIFDEFIIIIIFINDLEQKIFIILKNHEFFRGFFCVSWEQRKLWTLTIWDKKFNEVDSEKQPKVIKYPYVLADVFKQIEDNSGNVLLLSTGSYVGYTTEGKAGASLCEGEVVAIPWGGTANVKYYKGKFVTADNRIATSSDSKILSNKHIALWLQSHIKLLESLYRGASIKHPSMSDVLSLVIDVPSSTEQEKISDMLFKLDNLITLHQRKYLSKTPRKLIKKLAIAWEQRKLGEISTEIKRNEPDSVAPVMMIAAATGFINQSEKYSSNNAGQSLTKYILLKKGELAYNHGASKIRAFGSCFDLKEAEEARIPFVYHCFSVGKNNPRFVSICLNSDELQRQLRCLVSSGARMDGLLNISFDSYSTVKIKCPTKEEQDTIARCFDNLDNLITLHQRKHFREGSDDFSFSSEKMDNAWEQRKYEYFFEERNERSGEGEMISVTINSGIKKFNELGRFDTKPSDLSKYKRVVVGDIAYNSMRMWQGASGYSPFTGILSPAYTVIVPKTGVSSLFFSFQIKRPKAIHEFEINSQGLTKDTWNLKFPAFSQIDTSAPNNKVEQDCIAEIFINLDNLITLHQQGDLYKRRISMTKEAKKAELFVDYFERWVKVYKDGAIRKVTMNKYLLAQSWLKKLVPNLKLSELDRIAYQKLLNDYAKFHERQTTMDFHHQLKGAILDAVDEGLISRDPTRKSIIKGKTPRVKKPKYLSQFELHTLINQLDLKSDISWDWLILIVAKTGMRFSEALAITPKDFDFSHQSLSIEKTWDYKGNGGFLPTKNKSSVRKIQIDWQTVVQFSELIKGKPEEEPLFVNCKVYNSTVNDFLRKRCKEANIPVISIHGLRHTHASLLLFAGVSIASVARRLGHASMTTTQKTYLHIIHELENKDIDLVMRSLSSL